MILHSRHIAQWLTLWKYKKVHIIIISFHLVARPLHEIKILFLLSSCAYNDI